MNSIEKSIKILNYLSDTERSRGDPQCVKHCQLKALTTEIIE